MNKSQSYPFWRKGFRNGLVFAVVVVLVQTVFWVSHLRLWGNVCVIITATISAISFGVVFVIESYRPEVRKK